jgi:hypothetical protein
VAPPEGSGPQQMGRVAVVLHIVGGHGGVRDPVVDHGIHSHRYRIPGQDLEQHLHLTEGKQSNVLFIMEQISSLPITVCTDNEYKYLTGKLTEIMALKKYSLTYIQDCVPYMVYSPYHDEEKLL